MVKEGFWYGLPLMLASGGLMGFRLYGASAFFLVLGLLVFNFFRDPDREIPPDPQTIVSPADGRVVEIAGLLARRIVFWKRPGDALARGERVGLIKFGSRVDVLIDRAVELQVKVGDRVRAGSSILGRFQI